MSDEKNLTLGQMGKLLGTLAQNLTFALDQEQVQKMILEDPSTIQRLGRVLKRPHQQEPTECMFIPKDVDATKYFDNPVFSGQVQQWWRAGVDYEHCSTWSNAHWLRLEYVDTRSHMSLNELQNLHAAHHPGTQLADTTLLLQVVATLIECQGVEDPGLLLNNSGWNVFMVNTHEYGTDTLVLTNPTNASWDGWYCDKFEVSDRRTIPAESRIFTFFL